MDFQEALPRFLITFPIFLFALSFHEMAHAITARWGGDQTSAYQGRVTLNPIPHIDIFGTILIPFAAVLFGGVPLIGWAKPVPVVEENFRRGGAYGVVVALAGPFSNFFLMLVTVVVAQVILITLIVFDSPLPDSTVQTVFQLVDYSIRINLVLMCFNLIPIPPLDGSHVLWHWFIKDRPQFHQVFFQVRQFSYIILILLISSPAIAVLYNGVVAPMVRMASSLIALPFQFLG